MVLELTILFLFPRSTGDGAVRAGTPAITVSSFMSKAYVCMDTLCKWMGVRRPGITFMVIIVLSRSLFGFSHKILWKNSNEIFGQPNTMETVTDFFFFLGSKVTADGDCSHEIKRCLLLGRKVMTDLDSIFKSRDITLPLHELHFISRFLVPNS